jgi:hypothetical protein
MNKEILSQYRAGIRLASKISEQRKLDGYVFLTCTSASNDARRELCQSECNVVYFFYAEDGTLLYVGRTDNFARRWSQHLKSDKDMVQISKVCLHLFDTTPETIFYEAQKIAGLQPKWNIAGIDGKVARNTIKPWHVVWFDCTVQATEDQTDSILESMELYYTQQWYDRMSDNDLEREFYKIHACRQRNKKDTKGTMSSVSIAPTSIIHANIDELLKD